MSTSTSPRIYVASLSDYNAGRLHGVWIDATLDPDAIEEQIRAMLFESAHPNVTRCRKCGATMSSAPGVPPFRKGFPAEVCEGSEDGKHDPASSAEEYAIHDYEGFAGIKLSEFESIGRVSELANAIEEHGEIFAKYIEHTGEKDVSDAVSDFQDAYSGTWKSEEDFAADLAEETGMVDSSNSMYGYIDWEKFARDLFISDYFSIDLDGETHVFRNC